MFFSIHLLFVITVCFFICTWNVNCMQFLWFVGLNYLGGGERIPGENMYQSVTTRSVKSYNYTLFTVSGLCSLFKVINFDCWQLVW